MVAKSAYKSPLCFVCTFGAGVLGVGKGFPFKMDLAPWAFGPTGPTATSSSTALKLKILKLKLHILRDMSQRAQAEDPKLHILS